MKALIKWSWEGLGAGEEGDDRGWAGWMASLTRWTWVWVNSGSWWWTGRPGMLWFMGSQRVRHDWVTELNWTERFALGFKELTRNMIHKPHGECVASSHPFLWDRRPSSPTRPVQEEALNGMHGARRKKTVLWAKALQLLGWRKIGDEH